MRTQEATQRVVLLLPDADSIEVDFQRVPIEGELIGADSLPGCPVYRVHQVVWQVWDGVVTPSVICEER